jgi:hypothetical protein
VHKAGLTNLSALGVLQRSIAEPGSSIAYLGATVSGDDHRILDAVFGDAMTYAEHPYGDRKFL